MAESLDRVVQVQQACQQRYQNNLAFFKAHYPEIYRHFVNYEWRGCQFVIDPSSGKVDLNDNGKPLYGMDAKDYAEQELATFCATSHTQLEINSIGTYGRDSFNAQRFFGKTARYLAQLMLSNCGQEASYQLSGFYPLIVFMGVGLGHHIAELIEREEVHHAVIVESNFNHFAASLHSIDWQKICGRFNKQSGQMLSFILHQPEETLTASIWQQLLHFRPIFPLTTIFYNHRGYQPYWHVINQLNDSLILAVTGLGEYDDEVNQVNNAIHNMYQSVDILPYSTPLFEGRIIVVGSGPSLDNRIEELKQVCNDATVISSGTALKVLYHHGIKPDIHIEIETDKLTAAALDYIDDKEWMANILFIGPAQVSPIVFNRFRDKAMFFRKSGAVGKMFGLLGPQLEDTTPTVVNGAFALAAYYGAREILLFGIDCGFYHKESHHAEGTLYSDPDLAHYFKVGAEFEDSEVFEINSVANTSIFSTRILFTSKRVLESSIARLDSSVCKVYNCSDGAAIVGAEHIAAGKLATMSEPSAGKSHGLKEYLLGGLSPVDNTLVDRSVQTSAAELKQLSNGLAQILEKRLDKLHDISLLCGKLSQLLQAEKLNSSGCGLALVKGSIDHLVYLLYSASFTKQSDLQFATEWRVQVQKFLQDISSHYDKVVNKKFVLEQDPWLDKSLYDAED